MPWVNEETDEPIMPGDTIELAVWIKMPELASENATLHLKLLLEQVVHGWAHGIAKSGQIEVLKEIVEPVLGAYT